MLRLNVRCSPQLAWLLGGVHAGAFGLALTASLPGWLYLLLAPALAASAGHGMLLHAWQRLPRSIIGLEVSEGCEITLLTRDGAAHESQLLPSSFVTPWLTVLNLRAAGSRWPRALVLLPDRVDPDLYRRLRVWLRWRCRKGAAEGTRLS